ncbi:hypothetical protein [Enterovibrio norvegicus]|uniref:hypothetical protein n=1 Tax=Enterovibrio norvegicus TaxID=188144 RepID=UPI001F521323|nr:hypothetical protein [Enterovibrio norvegicus]
MRLFGYTFQGKGIVSLMYPFFYTLIGLFFISLYFESARSALPATAFQVALPIAPSFTPTTSFDGTWEGKHVDENGQRKCAPSEVLGTIRNGFVSFHISHDNSTLKGWISESGELEIYSDSMQWGYHFSGSASHDALTGEWGVSNAACNGHWSMSRVSV